MNGSKTIRVDYLARVEGEGAVEIKMKGGQVQEIQFRIFEPPRMFEAFLRGRCYSEVPDIVARICGICPVAYQMSGVQALESILGITVDPAVRLLRRLLYCGEWIESHVLHVYMLHAPDFLGYPDALVMAGDRRELVEQALRLKKAGNDLMILLGGREIHPISVAVGGFYSVPAKHALNRLVDDLRWARDAAIATAKVVAGFEFPDFEQDYEFVALSNPEEYAICEGRMVSNRGLDIETARWNDFFVEQHVKHSTALHARVRERGSYLVGPLARFNLNFAQLPETARQVASECAVVPPVLNPFRSIVVRAVETVFACEEALRLIAEYEPPSQPLQAAVPRAGTGHGATEAPRGMLYHRYELDSAGLVVNAQIVPPTAQNQKRIEDDLWHYVPGLAGLPAETMTARCEQAVRNYDPCISCSTHFVRINRRAD